MTDHSFCFHFYCYEYCDICPTKERGNPIGEAIKIQRPQEMHIRLTEDPIQKREKFQNFLYLNSTMPPAADLKDRTAEKVRPAIKRNNPVTSPCRYNLGRNPSPYPAPILCPDFLLFRRKAQTLRFGTDDPTFDRKTPAGPEKAILQGFSGCKFLR
jgi:hypothetical protein